MKEIRLRPHHCLCTRFFVGKGYNEEFIRRMTEIIDFLEKDNPQIILTDKCDDICSCCPNRRGNICKDEYKVHNIDQKCLSELKLSAGDKITWTDIKSIVSKKIIECGKLHKICNKCQWYEICSELSK